MLFGNCGIGPYKSYEISIVFVFASSVQRYLLGAAGHLWARYVAWSSIAGKPRAKLGTAMFACYEKSLEQ